MLVEMADVARVDVGLPTGSGEVLVVGARLGDHVLAVEARFAHEDEGAQREGAVVGHRVTARRLRELQVVEVAEPGVDLLLVPDLSDREERVTEAGDAADVGELESNEVAAGGAR